MPESMMPQMSSNCPNDVMKEESLEKVAQEYRNEGYDVIVQPRGDLVPPFAAGFQPNLIGTRGVEGVAVVIKTNRIELSRDPQITRLAEIVEAQPGWRLDVIVLEPETAVQRAAQGAAEPSDEQLVQILKTADELADRGYSPYACVVAWGGLEAAMRRIGDEAQLYGRTSPNEFTRALYSNGFISREQFNKLKEAYKVRSQVVHGLIPPEVDPALVRDVTATARYPLASQEVALPSI
jgi:REase_AHJR-like